MNPNVTSAPNTDTWARALAEHLKGRLPHMADAVAAGMTHDYTFLGTIEDDDDLFVDFERLWEMVEAYRTHVMKTTRAENRDLLIQNQQLKADIQEMAEKIRVLVKSLEQLSPQDRSSEIHSGTDLPILKGPEPFSGGEKDAVKRQQEFVAWRSRIESCFAQDAAAFDNERRKILHIAGLLDGDAFESNQSYFDAIALEPSAVHSWHWKTADEVFQSLSAQFGIMDLQGSQKFDHLYMIHKQFKDFIFKFRNCDQPCIEGDAQEVNKNGSNKLADKEADQPLPPTKDEIDAWCNLCQRLALKD